MNDTIWHLLCVQQVVNKYDSYFIRRTDNSVIKSAKNYSKMRIGYMMEQKRWLRCRLSWLMELVNFGVHIKETRVGCIWYFRYCFYRKKRGTCIIFPFVCKLLSLITKSYNIRTLLYYLFVQENKYCHLLALS